MNDRYQMTTPKRAQSFIVAIRGPGTGRCLQENILDSGYPKGFSRSEDDRLEAAFCLRRGETFPGNGSQSRQAIRLILGDDAEWRESLGETCMAYGTFVEFDTSRGYLKGVTSVVGLPPLFIYRDPALTVITSDLYLLTRISGVNLHFNVQAINDLCRIGHPVSGMTLFSEIALVSGGSSLVLEADGQLRQSPLWAFGRNEEVKDWASYTELQAGAIKRAMDAIDISKSFLSLTAGLDTRAIMAMLVAEKRFLPAYTLTGKTLTLDAMIARNLCRAYDFPHTAVVLGDSFFSDLPMYVTEASRLSGGLASLDQAHEIYFYRSTGRDMAARLSGNLGNQVGRRGVERVSMRNADVSILGDSIRRTVGRGDHWYANERSDDGGPDFEFLIRNEIPSSSVANYCIGNYFAIQQSPYANRWVIENVTYMPKPSRGEQKLSVFKLRLRDLKHRFFGDAPEQSFQVRLIRETGGYLASCAINWGWRAKGGVSLKGITYGSLAFLDALASSRRVDSGVIQRSLRAFGITGLQEFKHAGLWLRSYLRDFVYDTLLSFTTRNSGLFHNGNLAKALEEHYSARRSHEKEIVLALDLALAREIFKPEL